MNFLILYTLIIIEFVHFPKVVNVFKGWGLLPNPLEDLN